MELTQHLITPIEFLVRSTIKNIHFFKNEKKSEIRRNCTYGHERVLAPYLGEMGLEVRNTIARVEPYLRAGWKIMTRKPAFYPRGCAIYDPDFFARIDGIMRKYDVFGSNGGIHIPLKKSDTYSLTPAFSGPDISLNTHMTSMRMYAQAFAEIELRELFNQWLYFEGRPLTEFDHWALSFFTTAQWNADYSLREALPPSFRPPGFETPPEPIPPHIGVQIRHQRNGLIQPRNSDPVWMLQTAKDLSAHLGLELIVYGHPDGCILPEGYRHSWDPARTENFSERELGYLSSCRLMLSANSGWVDLMAWLGIPVLLEGILPDWSGIFEPLRNGFAPRIHLVDRSRPVAEQADALLCAKAPVLPDPGDNYRAQNHERAAFFPWDF